MVKIITRAILMAETVKIWPMADDTIQSVPTKPRQDFVKDDQ